MGLGSFFVVVSVSMPRRHFKRVKFIIITSVVEAVVLKRMSFLRYDLSKSVTRGHDSV